MAYLNGGPWKLIAEYTEVETGKRADRPELQKALAACRKHKAKLVIAKLDRLSRNLAFIATLMDSNVRAWLRIFVVRCGLPCDPPVGGHSCNGGMIRRFYRPVCD
jgi:Resolvase, N terminal domain